MAQVWNDHSETHVEDFEDRTLTIPPNGHIEMPYDKAIMFKGKYQASRDNRGKKQFKMIRVIKTESDEPKQTYTSHLDGKEFANKGALEQHLELNKHLAIKDDDEISELKKENDAMKEEISEIKDLLKKFEPRSKRDSSSNINTSKKSSG